MLHGSLISFLLIKLTSLFKPALLFSSWPILTIFACSTKEAALTVFLSEPALSFVLQLMRGCVWTRGEDGKDPKVPPFPTAFSTGDRSREDTRRLLAFLHKLETSKSVDRVGLLTEDLLDEWVNTVSPSGKVKNPSDSEQQSPTDSSSPLSIAEVIQNINDLRQLTVQRNRRLANEVRQRQLHSLNMKVNEKGQVGFMQFIIRYFMLLFVKCVQAQILNPPRLHILFSKYTHALLTNDPFLKV